MLLSTTDKHHAASIHPVAAVSLPCMTETNGFTVDVGSLFTHGAGLRSDVSSAGECHVHAGDVTRDWARGSGFFVVFEPTSRWNASHDSRTMALETLLSVAEHRPRPPGVEVLDAVGLLSTLRTFRASLNSKEEPFAPLHVACLQSVCRDEELVASISTALSCMRTTEGSFRIPLLSTSLVNELCVAVGGHVYAILMCICLDSAVPLLQNLPPFADILAVAAADLDADSTALCSSHEIAEELACIRENTRFIASPITGRRTSSAAAMSPFRLKRTEPSSPGRILSAAVSPARLGKQHPSEMYADQHDNPPPVSRVMIDCPSVSNSSARPSLHVGRVDTPTARSVTTVVGSGKQQVSPESQSAHRVALVSSSSSLSVAPPPVPSARQTYPVATARARQLLARLDRMKQKWSSSQPGDDEDARTAAGLSDMLLLESDSDVASMKTHRSSSSFGVQNALAASAVDKSQLPAADPITVDQCKARFYLCGNKIMPAIVTLPENAETGVPVAFEARPVSEYSKLCRAHGMHAAIADSALVSSGLGLRFRLECNTQSQTSKDDFGQQVFETPDLDATAPSSSASSTSATTTSSSEPFIWTFRTPGVYDISDVTYPFIRARLLILPAPKRTIPVPKQLVSSRLLPDTSEAIAKLLEADNSSEEDDEDSCDVSVKEGVTPPANHVRDSNDDTNEIVPITIALGLSDWWVRYLLEWLLYLVSPLSVAATNTEANTETHGIKEINSQLEEYGMQHISLSSAVCRQLLAKYAVSYEISGGHIHYFAGIPASATTTTTVINRVSNGGNDKGSCVDVGGAVVRRIRLRAVMGVYGSLPQPLLQDLVALCQWLGCNDAKEWPDLLPSD